MIYNCFIEYSWSGACDVQESEIVPMDVEGAGEEEEPSEDRGVHYTVARLRQKRAGNSHIVLNESVEQPIGELDIPLCRMVAMTDVRSPLLKDIAKLKAEFATGYRRGGPCFYVSLHSYALQTQEVTDEIRAGWSDTWKNAEKTFEDQCQAIPELRIFSNKMFFIWDGNHRFKAWMEEIQQFHYDDPDFHPAVKSIVLRVSEENNQQLLNAMTHWNK